MRVELKNRPFTIRVIQGNKQNKLLPGFLCESLLESNEEVENDLTNAISKLYKKIFQTETCFFRTLVMGMDDNNILDKIVSDLSFQPFSIHIQKINIIIHSIGMSAKQGTGCKFTSSFIYTKSKERTLFFQTISENGCSIYVYKKNQLSKEFHGSDTNSVQLGLLYPKDYIFSEREIRAWWAILHATGCVNIIPFDKGESEYEFWTRSSDPEPDKTMVNMLYQSGFLRTIPNKMFNATEVFWESFEHSLNLNKHGANGKQRILSIIVSLHIIHNAKIHGRVYGHGCPAAPKPSMRRKIILQEYEDQFE
ncbi:hypothetical protein RclHR1_09550006 [Rhizophagus clarus]|uniref:Uncharacterized protein n=1 Tax=Rhizophagus clarus TaxID=94130 RepID=A0A2Z6SEZ1_9GLOM|nr:hypothetical protein RclHR1_09550006 [Rhizophagus clarus]